MGIAFYMVMGSAEGTVKIFYIIRAYKGRKF